MAGRMCVQTVWACQRDLSKFFLRDPKEYLRKCNSCITQSGQKEVTRALSYSTFANAPRPKGHTVYVNLVSSGGDLDVLTF